MNANDGLALPILLSIRFFAGRDDSTWLIDPQISKISTDFFAAAFGRRELEFGKPVKTCRRIVFVPAEGRPGLFAFIRVYLRSFAALLFGCEMKVNRHIRWVSTCAA